MLRNSLLSLVLLFAFFMVVAQEDSCHVRFQVKGYTGGKVIVIGSLADQNYLADSCLIDANGNFELKRKSPLKKGLFFVVLPENQNFQLILDENQKFSVKADRSNIVKTFKADKSKENELLYKTLNFENDQKIIYDSLYNLSRTMPESDPRSKDVINEIKKWTENRKKYLEDLKKNNPTSFFVKFKLAGQNPEPKDIRKPNGDLDTLGQLEQYRVDFWNNVDFTDERLLYTPVLSNKLKKFIMELTPQNPDSIIRQADVIIQKSLVNKELFQFISNWIAFQYQPTKTNVMDGEAVYVHIINKYFTRDLAYWLDSTSLAGLRKKAWEMEASTLGKIGQNVTSTAPDGSTKSLYDLKKPYTVVYMYTPSCEHCQKETPILRRVYEENKDKFDVFAIVLDTNQSEWENYIKKNDMGVFTNVYDPSNRSIYAKYFVDITPEVYVLNSERKLIGKNLKPDQIMTIIDRDMRSHKK